MRNALIALALLLAPACSTYYDHRFTPAPVDVDLSRDQADVDARARGLVTVVGIRKPDDGRGAVVEVRLRVENLGAQPVELVPDSLVLVSADLREMGQATVVPDPAPIAQGEQGTYQVEFELPSGKTLRDYDLQGLNLKFEVDYGDQRVMHGITFDRYGGLYPREPRVSFGFGYYYAD